MGTSTRVPETVTIAGDELSADDAVTTLRRYGRWNLVKDSFVRFRYADGFTNARAVALQVCLAFIPFVIAAVGLSSALHHEKAGQVIIQTLARVLPGGEKGDMVQEAAQRTQNLGATGGRLASTRRSCRDGTSSHRRMSSAVGSASRWSSTTTPTAAPWRSTSTEPGAALPTCST